MRTRIRWGTALLLAPLLGMLLLGTLSPAQTEGGQPEAGLIAYWPFDEGSGELAQDATGQGHDGELKNGPEWVEGVQGSALRFDGLDDYVLVAYQPDFRLEQGLTIALWVYLESDPDTGPDNDWRLLVGRNGFSPYGLLIEQNRRLNGSVYIGGDRQAVQSQDPLPLKEWVHVGFTYDAEAGLARLYVNGAQIIEVLGAVGAFKQREGRPLTISLPKREETEEIHAWPGLMDEIYIYGRALSDTEIQQLFERASQQP